MWFPNQGIEPVSMLLVAKFQLDLSMFDTWTVSRRGRSQQAVASEPFARAGSRAFGIDSNDADPPGLTNRAIPSFS